MANDEKERQAPPLRLKKLYVLSALLVEQYHEQNKAKAVEKTKGPDGKALEVGRSFVLA